MDTKKLGLIAAVVVILVLAYGGYQMLNNRQSTDQTDTSTQITTTTQDSTNASDSGAIADEGVKEFTIDGSNFKFDPSTITVNQGDKVKIIFKNIEGTHDFVIDALNIKTATIESGEDETVEFTADQAGSFEYYCSVGTHRAMGMKGTLVVN